MKNRKPKKSSRKAEKSKNIKNMKKRNKNSRKLELNDSEKKSNVFAKRSWEKESEVKKSYSEKRK